MKFRRFCTVFLLLALLLTQLWPVTAYAVEDIQLDAKAALLVDGATGTVLLDQDAHTKQYPASITKVMTALLVFEAIDRGELRLSDSITASANSVAGLPDDASTADIVAGETLTVEQAIHKMTQKPAEVLHLPGKGVLAAGMDADINVFAPEKLHQPGTYENPCCLAEGMDYVLVDGAVAVEKGKCTGVKAGQILRR